MMLWSPRNFVVAFVAVGVFGPLIWFLMDRVPPYTFEAVEVSPAAVPPGSEIRITFTVRQNRVPCGPGQVYREFKEVHSRRIFTYDPILRAEFPVIMNNSFVRIATLPKDIAVGPAVYRGIACYTCNPVQQWLRWPVCTATQEVPFHIVEEKP